MSPEVRQIVLRGLVVTVALLAVLLPSTPAAAQPARLLDENGKLPDDIIVVYPILGTIRSSLLDKLTREVDYLVDDLGVRTIVFEISSPGGEVEAGRRTAEYIFDLHRNRGVLVYAYVADKTYALSAAALIALAAPTIVMAEDTQIGDIIPIDGFRQELGEKFQGPIRAKARFYAEENGYPAAIAEGMVSKGLTIYQLNGGTIDGRRYVTGVDLENHLLTQPNARQELQPTVFCPEGQAVVLSGREAWECKIAAKISPSVEHMVTDYGLSGEILYAHRDFERISTPLTDSAFAKFLDLSFVKFILIVLGVIGVAIELKMPGTLIPGGIGLFAFLLFFAGGIANGNAGWLEVSLFVAGGALIAAEIFVIPGFGVAGLSGFALLFSSLVLALRPTGELSAAGFVSDSVLVVTSLGVGLVGIVSLLWVLPKFGLAERAGFVDHTTLESTGNLPGASSPSGTFKFLHEQTGRLLTDCRPAGKAVIDDREYDVVTDTGFLERDSEIRVVRVEGNRIVVRAAT